MFYIQVGFWGIAKENWWEVGVKVEFMDFENLAQNQEILQIFKRQIRKTGNFAKKGRRGPSKLVHHQTYICVCVLGLHA